MFKSVLSSLIVSQMIFMPVSFAETKQVPKPQTAVNPATPAKKAAPLNFNWEGDTQTITTPGGTVVPPANNVMFKDDVNDPWGNNTDPTGGTLGTGGLGGGLGGNWEPDLGDLNNPYGGSSVNNTDTLITYFLKGSEVLTTDYGREISLLRRNYSYLNDLEIAQKIVSDSSTMAAGLGASTAAASTIIQYLSVKLGQSGMGGAWGMGAAVTAGTVAFLGQEYLDFSETTKIQADMILRLAALFGETPSSEQGKIRLVYNTFLYGAAAGGASSLASASVSAGVFKSLGGKAAQEVGEKAAVEIGEKALEQAVVNEVGKAAATTLVKNTGFKFMFASWLANQKVKQFVGGMVGGAVGAGISFTANKIITRKLGDKFYLRFFTEQLARKTYAISYVRTLPMARGTLWLLLTRDVFKRIPNPVDQKKFAQIVSAEIPLVKTTNFNEAEQLMTDFRADPKMIENNLAQLNHELNPEAKLYFMRLIMAGMLMKGSFDAGDEKTLNDVTNILGLQPPPNGPKLNERDRRQDIVTRYYGLKKEMASTVTNTIQINDKIAKGAKLDPKSAEKAKNAQVWGAAGTIILEDFEEATHDLILMYEQDVSGQNKTGGDSGVVKQDRAEKEAKAKMKGLKKEAEKAPGLK